MTPLQALVVLEHVQDYNPAHLPCPREGQGEPLTPMSLAALASLSGALDDATDWGQLCEAIEHGFTLMSAEILSFDEISDEVIAIAHQAIREAAAHGP